MWTNGTLAAIAGWFSGNDGLFFIEDVDFVNLYNPLGVGYYFDGWVHSIAEVIGDVSGTTTSFYFTVPTPQ